MKLAPGLLASLVSTSVTIDLVLSSSETVGPELVLILIASIEESSFLGLETVVTLVA